MAVGIKPARIGGVDSDRDAALQENVEVLQGIRGNPLDRALVVRDLIDPASVDTALLLSNITTSSNQHATFAYQLEQITFNAEPLLPPTDLVITPGFGAVFLQWAGAGQRSYAHTEIWRSATVNIAQAIRVGTAIAEIYVDYIGDDQTYYYWIRFVSTYGVYSPYNSADPVIGVTAPSGTFLANQLVSQISETQLTASLTSRIDLVDAPSTVSGSVANQILSESALRVAADAALSADLVSLTATVAGQGSTTLQVQADVSALYGQYTVKLDNNGNVAGFGLASESTTAGATSTFQVAADRFVITDPTAPDTFPFIVANGSVFLDTAYLNSAEVSNLLIANGISANDITSGSLSAINITGGIIEGAEIYVPAQGPSARFSINSAGDISIRSGTTGARMEMENNFIRVRDELGRVRVVIGDLIAGSAV